MFRVNDSHKLRNFFHEIFFDCTGLPEVPNIRFCGQNGRSMYKIGCLFATSRPQHLIKTLFFTYAIGPVHLKPFELSVQKKQLQSNLVPEK